MPSRNEPATASGSYTTVTTGVTPFWQAKYERDAPKYWHKFYERNGERFYKDRHWLCDEESDGFGCLISNANASQHAPVVVLECGCGAANAAFPLLAANPHVNIYAFDFAPSAVALVRAAPAFDPRRMNAFVWDFARDNLECVPSEDRGGLVSDNSVDFALCLFVLSAVPPPLQAAAVRRVERILRPGGRLLFRDYCVSDLAATRFRGTSKIHDNYFVRQDSTLSFFFDENVLDTILRHAGLVPVEMRRIERKVVNRKEGKEMNRVWLQAVYEKPSGKDPLSD